MPKTICILFFISALFGSAQNASIKKARKMYDSYSYDKVVERLEDKKDISVDARRSLAESLKMTGNYLKAEEAYSQIIQTPEKTNSDLLAYAQLLKINGKYSEAVQQMEEYSKAQANDQRALMHIKNKNYAQELLKDKGQFRVRDLQMNSAQEDFGLTYFKNQVVFTSSRHDLLLAKRKWNGNNLNFLDLYVADIDSLGEITTYTLMGNSINKKYHEGPISYNKKGSVLFVTRNNYLAKSHDGTTKLELFESKLHDGKWTSPEPFPYNDKEYSVGQPALSIKGNILYFVSDMPGGKGGTDIYRSIRSPEGKWGKPENLGDTINTEGNEMFPFVHESGMFFFSSDGHPGLGGLDVFVTMMNDGKFGKVANLGSPVNSNKDDFSFVLNEDQTKGYFASNREGGKGNDDIYAYDVLKPFVFGKILKGIAKDNEGNILEDAAVSLYNDKDELIKTIITRHDGAYSFDVEDQLDYKLVGMKEKYFDGKNSATTKGSSPEVTVDVILNKDPGFSLFALITDSKSGAPLSDVSMKITDENGNVVDYITDSTGEYRTKIINHKLGDLLKYNFELKKNGYLKRTANFVRTLDKPGEVQVHGFLDMTMGKIEIGLDIGKMVNIKPIYFDVNKFNVRKDAAIELDKIVHAMQEYPSMVIELGSHTDCRAPKAYNMSLSDKRAKASAAYIVSKGIAKDRIYGKGYGESKLKNGCACEGKIKSKCSEAEHQENRRTEFVIVRLKG